MVNLTILIFPTPYDAQAMVPRLQMLAAHDLIRSAEGALLCGHWTRQAPIVQPLAELQRDWMLDDAFWGILSGVFFYCPLVTLSTQNDEQGIDHSLVFVGVSTEVLCAVRKQIVKGTSALLLFIEAEVSRRISRTLEGIHFTLIEAPLAIEQEQWLQDTFSIRSS